MWLILIVLLILMLAGFPHWGYSANWGYGPSGILGFILLVVLIFWIMGRL
jgi:hypothetical protein